MTLLLSVEEQQVWPEPQAGEQDPSLRAAAAAMAARNFICN